MGLPRIVKLLSKSSLWLTILSLLVSACGDPQTVPPVQQSTRCTPEQNDYTAPIDQRLLTIYGNGVAMVSDTVVYDNYRQQAFNELVNRVFDWSDTVDVKAGEKNIRITITYISPELAQIIIINHFLYKGYIDFTETLDAEVKKWNSGIIELDEQFFFITFAASSYEGSEASRNSLFVKFPIKQLVLTNTTNLKVLPVRDDHNLEGGIDLTTKPTYGFISYPMAVIRNGNCESVMNKKHDTSLVLSVPKFSVNGTEYDSHSWEYKFAPLIRVTPIPGMKKDKFSVILPSKEFVPQTSLLKPTRLDDPEYWMNLARIIWLETTQDP